MKKSIIFLFSLSITCLSHAMWTDLHQAAKEGNLEEVKHLIDAGENFNVTDQDGNTPLHWAAFHDHAKVARLLIERGANINTRNKLDWIPLHLAAFNNSISVCQLLIDKTNINSTNKFDETPLDKALAMGHANVARLLLKNGAKINANFILSCWQTIRNHEEVKNLLQEIFIK